LSLATLPASRMATNKSLLTVIDSTTTRTSRPSSTGSLEKIRKAAPSSS
jgi:hypothetical protein